MFNWFTILLHPLKAKPALGDLYIHIYHACTQELQMYEYR